MADNHYSFLLFSDCFFMIEMILNLNTGYFSDGILVKYRKDIIKKYLKSFLIIDFLACFPFQLIFRDMKFSLYPKVGMTKIDCFHAF